MKNKTGMKFEVICLDDDCVESEMLIKIYSDETEVFSTQIGWEDIPLLISNLNHINNVYQMKNFSMKLKELQTNREVQDILNSWGDKNDIEE